MKKTVLLFSLFALGVTATNAQNTGIGTITPGTALDVNGALTNRETAVAVASNAATVPADVSLVRLTGAATANVTITAAAPPNPGQRLIVYNNTTGGFGATLNGTKVVNGRAIEFVYSNGGWQTTDNGTSAGSSASYWGITGNAGTTPGTNFIGTTDDQDLVFKRNGSSAGLINASKSNTALGFNTSAMTGAGTANTAIGSAALTNITTGLNNTGIGTSTLISTTTTSSNTAVGAFSLSANTGSRNTGVGVSALSATTNGDDNVAIGNGASQNSTTSSRNIAIGSGALNLVSNASDLTAIGYNALKVNSSGTENVALGNQVLILNTTGSRNTGLGANAAFFNISGNDITAVGADALNNNSSGISNTAIGSAALFNTTGNSNTAIGASAGSAITTGSNNIIIGSSQGVAGNTTSNQLNIGGAIFGTGLTGTAAAPAGNIGIGTASPAVRLDIAGGSSAAVRIKDGGDLRFSVDVANNSGTDLSARTVGIFRIFGWGLSPASGADLDLATGAWAATSDIRYKENITDLSNVLPKLKNVSTIEYNFKADKNKKRTYGFSAQNLVQYFPLAVNYDKEEDKYSVYYTVMIPVLTEAIKEQQERIEALEKENQLLKGNVSNSVSRAEYDELKAMVEKLAKKENNELTVR